MACEDDDLVSKILQADCSIDDQPLGAANAQVWVQEDNGLLLLCCLLRRHILGSFDYLTLVRKLRRHARHFPPSSGSYQNLLLGGRSMDVNRYCVVNVDAPERSSKLVKASCPLANKSLMELHC